MLSIGSKIKCLVVDDEPMALSLIEKYVLQTPFLELVGKCSNAFEVLQFINQNEKPNLIFLDIQMPELNGMDLSKTLPPNVKVVFTTAFDHFAIEGYKVNALDYLLKPFDYTEFLGAAQKAKDWFEHTQSNETQLNYFFIKSEYKQVKIVFDDIYYIEGLKDYVKFYLVGQSSPILSIISLKKLEDELPRDKFMRIHRSYIVGLEHIDSIERNQVITQKQRITIADQYKERFEEFLQQKRLK
ncbi:MAG: LytTR family DNA-binding domain-containing protein [Chitinophagales bacterium]